MSRQHLVAESLAAVRPLLARLTPRSLVVLDVDLTLISPLDSVLRPHRDPQHDAQAHAILAPIMSCEPAWRCDKLTSLVYKQAAFAPTEPTTGAFLSDVMATGAHVLGLTAFVTPSYGVVADTTLHRAAELDQVSLALDSSGSSTEGPSVHFQKYAIPAKTPLGNGANAFDLYRGVLFSGSESKGLALASYLEHRCMYPDVCLALDDSLRNLDAIQEWYGPFAAAAGALSPSPPELLTVHYLGATVDGFDAAVAEYQVQHFLRTYTWLSDAQARSQLDNPNVAPSLEKHDESCRQVLDLLLGDSATEWDIVSYPWPDLDGIACSFGLRELLMGKGRVVAAETPSTEAATLLRWLNMDDQLVRYDDAFRREGARGASRSVVVVDASDPTDLPADFPVDDVRCVIDHRAFSAVERFASLSVGWVDLVGACATLICEMFVALGRTPSPPVAQLLYGAIASNTVRLSATNTTDRDRRMANFLHVNCEAITDTMVDELFLAKSNVPETAAEMAHSLHLDMSTKLPRLGDCVDVALAQMEIVGVRERLLQRSHVVGEALRLLREMRGNATHAALIAIDVSLCRTYVMLEATEAGSRLRDLFIARLSFTPMLPDDDDMVKAGDEASGKTVRPWVLHSPNVHQRKAIIAACS